MNWLTYILIRAFLFPFGWMPHKAIHAIGRALGFVAFYTLPKYRKRSLSNVALTDITLSPEQLIKVAIASMQNLVITCLEFPKFAKCDVAKSIICENPEPAQSMIDAGQGIVFFCGHQSNWETLFLDGTRRMPGVAIGRPIKNPYLYKWIHAIRERYGGTIVEPKKGIGKGLRALREGKFMGVVGDQGMPGGGHESLFLGRRAYTSPVPAMLAYKTGSPLMVATTRRKEGKYFIHYSDPIWPDTKKPMEDEVARLMDHALTLYAASIRENPGEWLWQHNRWKQEPPNTVYYRFRHETILIILRKEQVNAAPLFRKIYPKAFLTFFIPKGEKIHVEEAEVLYYTTPTDCLLHDYRYKLVLNIAGFLDVKAHYGKLAALEIVSLTQLTALAKKYLRREHTLTDVIERALCRPNTLWSPHASQ